MKQPILILIHGLPATGKTTIGKVLAKEMNFPFFCRDNYKEELFEILGEQDGSIDWSRKLGAASFRVIYLTIERILESGQSCIAETYWTPEYAEPKLTNIINRTNAKIVQIFFSSEEVIRKERFENRAQTSRHAVHMDTKRIEEKIHDDNWDYSSKNKPLNIKCELIKIDTSDFSKIEVQKIVKEIWNYR